MQEAMKEFAAKQKAKHLGFEAEKLDKKTKTKKAFQKAARKREAAGIKVNEEDHPADKT